MNVLADLLDVPTVAERLGVSKTTIHRAITRGDLEAVKVAPHRTLVEKTELARYLAELNDL